MNQLSEGQYDAELHRLGNTMHGASRSRLPPSFDIPLQSSQPRYPQHHNNFEEEIEHPHTSNRNFVRMTSQQVRNQFHVTDDEMGRYRRMVRHHVPRNVQHLRKPHLPGRERTVSVLSTRTDVSDDNAAQNTWSLRFDRRTIPTAQEVHSSRAPVQRRAQALRHTDEHQV